MGRNEGAGTATGARWPTQVSKTPTQSQRDAGETPALQSVVRVFFLLLLLLALEVAGPDLLLQRRLAGDCDEGLE